MTRFRTFVLFPTFFLLAGVLPAAAAGPLPGFSLEKVAEAEGFVTSLVITPSGELSYSVRTGEIYILENGVSRKVAEFETSSTGNEALLGYVWRSEQKIVAHYVAVDHTADLIGEADLESGEVEVLARLECDQGRPCSSEHHGGNVTMAPDGTIYFAIGDYGGGLPSQRDDSPGGKIWRLSTDNTLSEFARGFRNPFDLAVLPDGRLFVSDNGPVGEDEINIVAEDSNAGWPFTMGRQDPVVGMLAPVYTFPSIVAPTGVALTGGDSLMAGGALVTTFVTRSLLFFRAPLNGLLRDPVFVAEGVQPLIDVVQGRDGTIWVGGTGAIYRLRAPRAGDANGDGRLDDLDAEAIALEIMDGDGNSVLDVSGGSVLTGWGADANRDGLVDARDLVELSRLQAGRRRPVPRPE